MDTKGMEAGGSIVPTLRYRDVGAAIDWLCNAFGFERQLVVNEAGGSVRYAELTFGTGMVMVGPVEAPSTDEAVAQPAASGVTETQVCYLFVVDATRHCARAKAAGAEIILDIDDEESDGRGYSCRDPEGHVWTFGTYDPWERIAHVTEPARLADGLRASARRLALGGAISGIVVASAAVAGWTLGVAEFHGFDSSASASVAADAGAEAAHRIREMHQDRLAREQSEAAERAATERALEEARGQLARERAAAQSIVEERERLAVAERSANEQLAAVRKEREAAEVEKQQAQEQLAKAHSALAASEREAQAAQERAEKQQRAKEHPPGRKTAYRAPPPAPRPLPPFRPYARWDL